MKDKSRFQNQKSNNSSILESTDLDILHNIPSTKAKAELPNQSILSPNLSQIVKMSQLKKNKEADVFLEQKGFIFKSYNKVKQWNSNKKEETVEIETQWRTNSHHNLDFLKTDDSSKKQVESDTKIKQLNLDLKKQEKEILFLREENIKAKETIEEYKRFLEMAMENQDGDKRLEEKEDIEDIWRKKIEITDDLLLDSADEIMSKSCSSDKTEEEGRKRIEVEIIDGNLNVFDGQK